jgi:hypothetical protein
MFGEIHPTESGTWFSYVKEGYPLSAYAASPGRSQIAVFWKGHADASQLGDFCKVASEKILSKGVRPEFTMWVLTAAGRRRSIALDNPPALLRLQSEAHLIRLECRPRPEDAVQLQPILTAWARLDEPSPEDGVAVSLEPQNLRSLSADIAALVKQTADPEAGVDIGIIKSKLDYIRSDMDELSKK